MKETTQPTPERLAFLQDLSDTWGTPIERLLAIDADPGAPSSCCNSRGGCARCRPEQWG